MFKRRSYQKELLDEEGIPRDLLFRNLRELELVNIWLGGLQISLAGLRKAVKESEANREQKAGQRNHAVLGRKAEQGSEEALAREIALEGKLLPPIKVADIGCGGGDALRAMARYTSKRGWPAKFLGIDLKADCIDYARKTCADHPEVDFVQDDFREAIRKDPEITHVHAALFCHHLNDAELVDLIRFCRAEKKTLIVNDLQRHPLAYYSIWFLTRLLRGSKLVKNDAPLSVLRGFHRKELKAYLEQAGVKHYSLRWKWAFRYLLIVPHEAN